jgi:hypothetical protein
MIKLRLGPILDEKPIRLSIDMPAQLYRDLTTYSAILAKEAGQEKIEPTKLIAPMIEKFIRGDKAFAKLIKSKLAVRG